MYIHTHRNLIHFPNNLILCRNAIHSTTENRASHVMGNCIKKEASMNWGGEDWSSLMTPQSPLSGETGRGEKYKKKNKETEETEVTEPAAGGPRLVKIKLRRKELEELLGRADLQGMSAAEVVARLIGGCDGDPRSQEASRPWRPALQSIPEVD